MAVKPLWTSPPQFVDANGDPYSGALLFAYAAGSSTKQDWFTDDTGNTACPNPITLNSSGYPAVSGTILAPWGTVGKTYKIGLAAPGASDPPASFIWTSDDVAPINDTTVTIDQWVSGPAPTYIGATSFSLVGDQTTTFHVGRRLKTTNSGGTIYSTITASAYGALTTVTVLNDSGTLDAGLSAVSYGLLTADNPSTPLLADTYPIVSGSADKTKKLRFEVDGFTTATTRVATFPNADGTVVYAGTKTPTRRVFTTGSGTYTTPAGATALLIRMVGGGSGGAGSGTSGAGSGGAGGSTTFSTLTASGGNAATPGTGTNGDVNISGGIPGQATTGNFDHPGGSGGGTPFGGAGSGGSAAGQAGRAGATNSGGGGGGAGGSAATGFGGGLGGAGGGYVEKLLASPGASYSYAVGAAGTAGGAGTSGGAGGAGGSGLIIVDEFYT